MANVLVVDDERSIREFLDILLRRLQHTVHVADDVPSGIAALAKNTFDLILTDLRLPSGSGMDILRHVHEKYAHTQVVMMTAFATTENAVEAMKLGAYDYVLKPFEVDELTVVVERALERRRLQSENIQLRAELDARSAGSRLIGKSSAMRGVFDLVDKVAPTRTTVLLTGESGTGKELVARAIHSRSPRAADPFVPINCGAIPETLIESELFGHTKGSFTGAIGDKPGLFETAGTGTVFLDEIGELTLAMQVKLLRVLQERTVRRLGGLHDIPVECRVVAATNRNLEEEIQSGRFREDLYFRLNVIQVPLPALRERREDIPYLAEAFLFKFAEEQNNAIQQISDEAMRRLVGWHWPGNVRELENVIERGVTLCSSAKIGVDVLPPHLQSAELSERSPLADIPSIHELPEEGIDLEATIEAIERQLLRLALERTHGKKKKAAELLRLSFRSLRYRLAKHDLATSSSTDDGDDA